MYRPLSVLASLSLVLVLVLGLTAGCITSGGAQRSSHPAPTSRWLEASPALQTQIDENAERLPFTHGQDRIQLIRWFAGVGEPAYGTLLALASDERSDVAGSALAALGSTRDQRLVASVRALPRHPSGSELLQLERARTLLYLGDWEEAPRLIDALESDELSTRALAGYALYRATGEARGFDPKGTEEERAEAAERWRAWWQGRQDEGILRDAAAPR